MKKTKISAGLFSFMFGIIVASAAQAQTDQTVEELLLHIETSLEQAAEAAETSTDPADVTLLLEALQNASQTISEDLSEMAMATSTETQALVDATNESLDETSEYVEEALDDVSEAIEEGKDFVEVDILTQAEQDQAITPEKRKTWRTKRADRLKKHWEKTQKKLLKKGLSAEDIEAIKTAKAITREEAKALRAQVTSGKITKAEARVQNKALREATKSAQKEIRNIAAETLMAKIAEMYPEKALFMETRRAENQIFLETVQEQVASGKMSKKEAKSLLKEIRKADKEELQQERMAKLQKLNPKKVTELQNMIRANQTFRSSVKDQMAAGTMSKEQALEAVAERQRARVKARKEDQEKRQERQLQTIEAVHPEKATTLRAQKKALQAAQKNIQDQVKAEAITKPEAKEAKKALQQEKSEMKKEIKEDLKAVKQEAQKAKQEAKGQAREAAAETKKAEKEKKKEEKVADKSPKAETPPSAPAKVDPARKEASKPDPKQPAQAPKAKQ